VQPLRFGQLTRQGRSQIGSIPPIGPLPLVAHETCAHGAYILRPKTLRSSVPGAVKLEQFAFAMTPRSRSFFPALPSWGCQARADHLGVSVK
jgi:hypothetical protein